MASTFPTDQEGKVRLRTRKGHDMTWSCVIHGEPIKFYCKEHEIPICHPCAFKDHQKPCHVEDIGDVIFQMGKKLDDKLITIEVAKTCFEKLDSKIQSCATLANTHLQSVNDEVKTTYEGKLQSVRDNEQAEIRTINEEADEEIRIINEKRDKRIKACKTKAEQQQLILKESQAKVLSETKTIIGVVTRKIEDLKAENQHAIDTVDNMGSKIKRIRGDDETLVNEAPGVIASMDESANVRQDVAGCLDRIESEVQKVKFVEGKVGGEHYARIDGYIGKWELVKSFRIPSIVNKPLMRGLISDDEVCVWDIENDDLFITNISTEHTKKAQSGDNYYCIGSFACVDNDLIVCGRYKPNGALGVDVNIALCDRRWNLIRDTTIRTIKTEKLESVSKVYIDVDRDGMILACEYGQSSIYVINPADGKIVNTITMRNKKIYSQMQALSSGNGIVVEADEEIFSILSRSGNRKEIVHQDEWTGAFCFVNKLTDTLYITWDNGCNLYAVDQVSCDGNIQARRIIEYVKSDRSPFGSPCIPTPSGNLVACDGDKLFVYKKSFLV